MQHKINIAVLSFMLFVTLSTLSFSQTAGKKFTKEEANTLFGNVINSIKMSTVSLKAIMDKTEKYLMFRVEDGEVKILGDNRKAIYPGADAAVGKEDVYHVCSKSLIQELLDNNSGNSVYLETRLNVFSITYGENTLEEMPPCPPICVDN